MNIANQELFHKISTHSDEMQKQPEVRQAGRKNFRELLDKTRACKHPSEKERDRSGKKTYLSDDTSCSDRSQQRLSPSELARTTLAIGDDTAAGAKAVCCIKPSALNAEIEAAFEKMASCMIVMDGSGTLETTLFLDNPHFASSALFGTQVTIKEYCTAPKAFNVEITSNPSGAALIDAAKNDLLMAFREGNFNFTVHRFDTYIEQTSDRPLFHRKEDSGDATSQDQRGDDRQ